MDPGLGTATETKLSQDDFRKLMMTPRQGQSTMSSRTTTAANPNAGATPRRQDKPKQGARRKTDGAADAAGTAGASGADGDDDRDAAPKYRDRARERREGQLGEYTETAQILTQLIERADGDESKITYEQSKYLGGDVQHTHLVKGLDYALLEQVKKTDATTDDAAAGQETATPWSDVRASVDAPDAASAAPPAPPAADLTTIKSEFAQRIVATATKQRRREKSDLFLPGRMTFQFNLEDTARTDLPTTVIRSKADLVVAKDAASPDNELVIQKIRQLMLRMRQGGVRKPAPGPGPAKPAAPPKPAATVAVAGPAKSPAVSAVADDDDIFPDAGRFNAAQELAAMASTAEMRAGPAPGRALGSSSGWFRDDRARDRERHTAPPKLLALMHTVAPNPRGRGCGSTGLPQDPAGLAEPLRAGQIAMDGVAVELGPATADEDDVDGGDAGPSTMSDIHSIVQAAIHSAPQIGGAASFAGTRQSRIADTSSEYDVGNDDDGYVMAYDSDDETDYSKMDKGAAGKRAQLSRFDFENEEDYTKYKAEQEATPKAAFQFGVKTADGRSTRRGMNEKQKLNRDFDKISNIIRDQYKRPDLVPQKEKRGADGGGGAAGSGRGGGTTGGSSRGGSTGGRGGNSAREGKRRRVGGDDDD